MNSIVREALDTVNYKTVAELLTLSQMFSEDGQYKNALVMSKRSIRLCNRFIRHDKSYCFLLLGNMVLASKLGYVRLVKRYASKLLRFTDEAELINSAKWILRKVNGI